MRFLLSEAIKSLLDWTGLDFLVRVWLHHFCLVRPEERLRARRCDQKKNSRGGGTIALTIRAIRAIRLRIRAINEPSLYGATKDYTT